MKSFFKYLIVGIILSLFLPILRVEAGNISYYVNNGVNGSINAIVDQTGAIKNVYSYDSFGYVISSTGVVSNTYKYTGEQNESETGLIYLRNRYYDPSIARFVTKDLLKGIDKFPQSKNPYVYVCNNPLSFTDPFGLGEWKSNGIPIPGTSWSVFIPWLRIYHTQYIYDRVDETGECENFGFMMSGGPENDSVGVDSYTHGGFWWDQRDDAIMDKARAVANEKWGMYYGLPDR